MFLSITTIVLLLICPNGLQAQDTAKNPDQLKLAQKYFVGTWQLMSNDTIFAWDMKPDGNVIEEIDYKIVNGVQSVDSYWSYSYNPKENNFYIFAAYVNGGYQTLIGSFIAEDKWSQKIVEKFNADKPDITVEFVFDTDTSGTLTAFSKYGAKTWEGKITKIK